MEKSAESAEAVAAEAVTLAAIGAHLPVNRKAIQDTMRQRDKDQARAMLQAMLARKPI